MTSSIRVSIDMEIYRISTLLLAKEYDQARKMFKEMVKTYREFLTDDVVNRRLLSLGALLEPQLFSKSGHISKRKALSLTASA